MIYAVPLHLFSEFKRRILWNPMWKKNSELFRDKLLLVGWSNHRIQIITQAIITYKYVKWALMVVIYDRSMGGKLITILLLRTSIGASEVIQCTVHSSVRQGPVVYTPLKMLSTKTMCGLKILRGFIYTGFCIPLLHTSFIHIIFSVHFKNYYYCTVSSIKSYARSQNCY